MSTTSNAHHHSHHQEAGHSCAVPAPSTDRAAELGRLRFLATKVAMVHGTSHPAMSALSEVVTRVAAAPQSAIATKDRTAISTLTAAYVPWPDACGSVRALFDGLQRLSDTPVS